MKKSVWRPTLISLVSCALIFVICHRWGGWPLNVLGTAVFGGLISIFAFARESVLKDEEKVFEHIQSVVEQSSPLLRLAVAMAQPLRSYYLSMPIPMLTESFSDYGLYMLHRLDPAQYQNARNQIDDWKDMVRQNRDLSPDDPLEFLESLFALQQAPIDPQPEAPDDDPASFIVRLCYRIHLLVCAIEVDEISEDMGQHLLAPLVAEVQKRFPTWANYQHALQQGKWLYMRKDMFGKVAQSVHFRDLTQARMSPWKMTDIQLNWQC